MWKLALVVVILLINASCAHMTVPAEVVADSTHCPGNQGHGHESGPVICIDAIALTANPDNQPVHQGAWVHFYLTDTTQELDIQFKDSAKVQFKGKKGNECWLRVKDNAALGPAGYTAKNLATGQSHDPTIVIEP